MSGVAPVADPVLPPELGRALGLAVFAVLRRLGGEVVMVDAGDDVALTKLARVGSKLMLVERPGDRATSRPHRFTAYEVDETEPGRPFKLDPARALFVLHEKGFYSPPDWNLALVQDPRKWFNETMAAIHVALGPVAPRPN